MVRVRSYGHGQTDEDGAGPITWEAPWVLAILDQRPLERGQRPCLAATQSSRITGGLGKTKPNHRRL